MQKLESTFKNMVFSLVIISVVAAGALAGVYMLTLGNIDAQKKAKQEAAILAVLPEGAKIDKPEKVNGLLVYKAYDGEEFVGAAVQTEEEGFSGPQKIMVGFDAEGKILNYVVLEQTETPGLGSHIEHWFKNADKPGQNIIGRQANGAFIVSKDGGDVDAITAATISSRAFLKAINKAYAAFKNGEVEAHTGASQLNVQSDDVQSTKDVQSDDVQSTKDNNEEKEVSHE